MVSIAAAAAVADIVCTDADGTIAVPGDFIDTASGSASSSDTGNSLTASTSAGVSVCVNDDMDFAVSLTAVTVAFYS